MWRLDLSRSAEKFLDKNRLTLEEVRELIVKALRYFRGEDINVDIKKLKGESDIFRVRKGNMRIIYQIRNNQVFILKIGHRKEATYKL